MAPFYSSLCRDLQKPIDQSLLDEIHEINKTKIQVSIEIQAIVVTIFNPLATRCSN